MDQREADCEQSLGHALQTNWQLRQVDRTALGKRLILSVRQLNALVVCDPSAFHTYGLYLKGLRSALQEAGLLDDPLILEKLDFLVTRYSQQPHMRRILEVEKTLNRKLALAPTQSDQPDSKKQADARGVVALILVVTVVLVLSLYVGLSP